MRMRLRPPVALWALAVVSMTAGFLAITGPGASAAPTPTTNNWYVATTGNNVGNACSNKHAPCQTINAALAQQVASGNSGTIHVAAGTYNEQLTLTPANDNVKIKGAGASTVIQPPSSGLLSDTDTDSAQQQFYVIDVAPGTTGLTLNRLTVSGLSANTFLDGDGLACNQDFVGIYYHDASGAITNVSVNGIDMPADLFGCQGGLGIYVDSSATGSANVTMNAVSMLSPAATTTTTAKLLAGTYTNAQLAVTKVPKGFHSGPVAVNGFVLQATKDTSKVLFITGTTSVVSPKGSTVRLDPFTPAYDKNGITCDDQNTTCTINNSTVQGAGATNQIAQNGVQDFGAGTTTVSGSTISGNSYAGGGEGNSASGILVLNAGTVNVSNNTVSGSDVNIYAGEVPEFGLVATPVGTWTIGGNTVSGATSTGASAGVGGYGEGVQLDSTSNTVVLEGNTISASAQGNVLLTGVTGASIGAVGAGNTGNTIIGSQAGIVVTGQGTACEASGNCTFGQPAFTSEGNDFVGNNVGQGEAGVVVEGAYAPNQMGLSSDPGAALGNNFSGNTWTSLIGVVDFSGFNNPGDPATDGLPPSAPLENQYGTATPAPMPSNTADSPCEPTPGGSAALEGLAGGAPLFYSGC
jgi:hypothetical protein